MHVIDHEQVSLPLLTWHMKRVALSRVAPCRTRLSLCHPKAAEVDTLSPPSYELHEPSLNAQYEQFAFVSRKGPARQLFLKYNDSAFIKLAISVLSDLSLPLPNEPFLYFSEQYFCALCRLRCFLTAMYFDPPTTEHKILFTFYLHAN